MDLKQYEVKVPLIPETGQSIWTVTMWWEYIDFEEFNKTAVRLGSIQV